MFHWISATFLHNFCLKKVPDSWVLDSVKVPDSVQVTSRLLAEFELRKFPNKVLKCTKPYSILCSVLKFHDKKYSVTNEIVFSTIVDYDLDNLKRLTFLNTRILIVTNENFLFFLFFSISSKIIFLIIALSFKGAYPFNRAG